MADWLVIGLHGRISFVVIAQIRSSKQQGLCRSLSSEPMLFVRQLEMELVLG
jgi:hypothetical protein